MMTYARVIFTCVHERILSQYRCSVVWVLRLQRMLLLL